MSSVSAVILVGTAHPNDGGNRCYATVLLEEGDRPVLSLAPPMQGTVERPVGVQSRKKVMVPTLEDTLDDAVLYVAWAVCGLEPVLHQIEQRRGRRDGDKSTSDTERDISRAAHRPRSGLMQRIAMYDDFTPQERDCLYRTLKKNDELPKLTFCLFEGTLLADSIAHLQDYRMDAEVCRSSFVRSHSMWTRNVEISGSP